MSLKYEPASEPLHISMHIKGGQRFWWRGSGTETCLELRVQGSRFRGSGSGFRVQGRRETQKLSFVKAAAPPPLCSGYEAGSCVRLIDSCITQLKAQGPSRTCNESKEEAEEGPLWGAVCQSQLQEPPPFSRLRDTRWERRRKRRQVAVNVEMAVEGAGSVTEAAVNVTERGGSCGQCRTKRR